jgi:hypothetical protein
MKIGKLTLGIVLGALAVKVLAEKFVLFMECSTQSAHTISECVIIGVLY